MRSKPTGSLSVAELLSRWPQATAMFVARGLACPGCAMAPFDTLREVAAAYGLNLSRLLDEVGRVAEGGRPCD